MSWKYANLSDTLAGIYYRTVTIEALIIEAGLEPSDYTLDGAASVIWKLLIRDLEIRNKIQPILITALKKHPENPVLLDYYHDRPVLRNSVYAGKKAVWKNGVTKVEYEKITGGQSTLLPISFLEAGLKKSKAVARIVTPEGMGTGFLVSSQGHFLTNNHVFPNKELALQSVVQFNYQKTAAGADTEPIPFEVESTLFHTSETDDWTLVQLKGIPQDYEFLSLQKSTVKKNDFVNIIQHPGGEHKQIGLYHNVVTLYDEGVVQYLTDTMPGSSGSPVFNSKWEVVALHHSGGWFEEPGGGNPVLRNEGININRILKQFEDNNIQL